MGLADVILGNNVSNKKKDTIPMGTEQDHEQGVGPGGIMPEIQRSPGRKEEVPQQRVESLGDVYNALYKQRKELTEQEEAEASKKAKASALIMGLGDGISALTNLYYTTKGSPSVQQTSTLGKFQMDYERAKARRERLRDQLFARMEEAAKDQLFYARRKGEIQDQRGWEKEIREQSWKREDSKRTEDKAERGEVRRQTWEREDSRDAENRRRFDLQYGLNVKQADRTQKNAEAGIGLQTKRYELQDRKDKEARIYQFKKVQGDEIPFVIDGKTYIVGSKALASNVGNIVANILDDIRNSDRFRDKSNRDLAKDQEWYEINKALSTSKSDVKKLAESMKRYAKYSPSAIEAFQRLSDYYNRGKREAENGEDDMMLGLGWDSENGSDSLGLDWDK